MEIRPLEKSDIGGWIELRHRLWPRHDRAALVAETAAWAGGATGVFVAASDGALVGFAEVTMHDRAPGCVSSPVGYLEGWWVDEEHRGSGIGSTLLAAAETWARDRGAREMASDAFADDAAAVAAHLAAGFEEERAVVPLHKMLIENPDDSPLTDVGDDVSLRTIDDDNIRAVIRLDVASHQRAFVAPNAVSLAQYGVTTKAWTRAVYAGDTPVGYVLLSDDDDRRRYYLWRFMIDHRYQGRGFGRAAMRLVIDYVRTRPGANGLYTSYVPVEGGPEAFYKSLGFADTGRDEDGEVETFLAFS